MGKLKLSPLILLLLISNLQIIEPSIISKSYDTLQTLAEPGQHDNPITSEYLLLFVFLLFLAIVVVHLSTLLRIHFIPESIFVILLGVVFGFIGKSINSKLVTTISVFNPESFFLFVLPIIIFETGFSLQKHHFFHNLHIILILAIIGTFITFLLTGVIIWGFGQIGVSTKLPWFESLLIGAISCATDPVATLAIFKALDADPTLFIIVMGESILNDAVSLILYQSVLKYTLSEVWKPLLLFFVVFIGSIVIGVIIALILSAILRYFNLHRFPALETIYVLIFSYISYLIADSLSLSGILSCFFSGITFSQYGYYLLSSETTHSFTQFIRTYAFIGETIVFIYIGISVSQHSFSVSPMLIIITFLALIITRAICTFPTFYILKKLDWLHDLPYSIQILIWFSGLRGAISFSLCLSDSFSSSEHYETIQATVLLIVYLTIGIFGMGTYPLLKYFHIKSTDHDNTLESINKPYKSSLLKYTFLSNLDKYLKGVFNISPVKVEQDQKENADSSEEFIHLEELSSSGGILNVDTIPFQSSPYQNVNEENLSIN